VINVPLQAIPNQTLSLNVDNNLYDISIHSCRDNDLPGTGIMAISLSINNTLVVTGQRALPDFPIVPASYLQNGNFIIVTMDDEYPDWRQFGNTQSLIYVSQAELEQIQAPV
jgi:hypothetical protein